MARAKDDFRGLTGPQKAAVFILALGQEQSAKIFSRMDDDEIKELSQVMASLGSVSSSVIERLFVDFADQLSSAGSLVGSFDSTERLLAQPNSSRLMDRACRRCRRRPRAGAACATLGSAQHAYGLGGPLL
mgnify:CR=1 FL=1